MLGKYLQRRMQVCFTLNCKKSFSCLCDCLSVIIVVFFRPYVSWQCGLKGGRSLPPVWNLRLSFDSTFLSGLLLVCLDLLLILSSPFFCFWSSFLPTFQKFLYTHFLEIGLFVLPLFLVGFFSGWEMISWSIVSVALYLMAVVLAIYEFRHLYLFWFPDVCWWFFYLFL